jgi:hypothetical protein
VVRGIVCGGMTALGGLGHALPYLIPHFYLETSIAFAVVAVELAVISWIRTSANLVALLLKYCDPWGVLVHRLETLEHRKDDRARCDARSEDGRDNRNDRFVQRRVLVGNGLFVEFAER